MITFELAKQLKDTGLPQDLNDSFYDSNNGYVGIKSGREGYTDDAELTLYDDSFWRGGDATVSIPTLNELIEACGERFWRLEKFGDIWQCSAFTDDKESSTHMNGSTPEEAVARLWLELNKK